MKISRLKRNSRKCTSITWFSQFNTNTNKYNLKPKSKQNQLLYPTFFSFNVLFSVSLSRRWFPTDQIHFPFPFKSGNKWFAGYLFQLQSSKTNKVNTFFSLLLFVFEPVSVFLHFLPQAKVMLEQMLLLRSDQISRTDN